VDAPPNCSDRAGARGRTLDDVLRKFDQSLPLVT
jgi:hypothetical protein